MGSRNRVKQRAGCGSRLWRPNGKCPRSSRMADNRPRATFSDQPNKACPARTQQKPRPDRVALRDGVDVVPPTWAGDRKQITSAGLLLAVSSSHTVRKGEFQALRQNSVALVS